MSKEKEAEKLQQELALLNSDQSRKEVAFNPKTGELQILDNRFDLAPDATIMTDVANSGFAY